MRVYVDTGAADHGAAPTTDEVAAHLPRVSCGRSFDGASVRNHAKFLAIDHRFLLVTSANFSWSAENGNLELGVLIDNRNLRCRSHRISDAPGRGVTYEKVNHEPKGAPMPTRIHHGDCPRCSPTSEIDASAKACRARYMSKAAHGQARDARNLVLAAPVGPQRRKHYLHDRRTFFRAGATGRRPSGPAQSYYPTTASRRAAQAPPSTRRPKRPATQRRAGPNESAEDSPPI